MKIPSILNIQGITWTIKFSPDIEDNGRTDYDTCEIIIREQLREDQKLATLIHEIGHTLNSTVDHALLDSFMLQIFQVLNDNQLLCRHHN